MKKCFGTTEYNKENNICRRCNSYEDCSLLNPKKDNTKKGSSYLDMLRGIKHNNDK